MLDSIKSVLVPIHPEGYRFIGIFAAITLILFLFLPDFFGWIGVVLTLWCAYFFRDPERVTPIREGLIISPADGRISAIEDVTPPPELDLGEETRTSKPFIPAGDSVRSSLDPRSSRAFNSYLAPA